MIVNPFNNMQDVKTNEESAKKKNESVDIIKIQKHIVDNYIDYVKNENKEAIKKKIEEYIYESNNIVDEDILKTVIEKVFDKMFGYHILQKYIDSPDISDIRVVKHDYIYIKRTGKWEKADDEFESEEEFYEYVRYCVLKNNGNINFDTPIIVVSDKKYNLRIEAGILPVNSMSPSLVIRVHRNNTNINLETLFIKEEMFDAYVYRFLLYCINNKKNIVISGKGGSGKTTLLRAIINKIPDEIPITANEETTELYFQNKNIIQREVLENREESKNISLQKLMRHSLVMSNDVIVIGELKGEEASIFFDAIATGHIGLTTVHSDSANSTISRLVTLVKRDIKSERYKEEYIEKILASSIDYVIFMKDYKVNQIIEVGYDEVKNKVQNKEINFNNNDMAKEYKK